MLLDKVRKNMPQRKDKNNKWYHIRVQTKNNALFNPRMDEGGGPGVGGNLRVLLLMCAHFGYNEISYITNST